jgi:phosphate transport system permease protein
MAVTELTADPPSRRLSDARPPGIVTDRVFRVVTLAAGLLVLVILALIIVATLNEAWPWFREEGLSAITSDNWDPAAGSYGALGLIYGTFLVATIAMIIAVPVSIGIALFVTEVAPRRLRHPIVYTIDLLAAVPSVVFGLWMLRELTQPLADIYASVSDALSGLPVIGDLFANPSASGQAFMTGGIVVGIMITPIVTAITREVFATTPASQKEAALALGATRWEMIRGAVFPHSRRGVVAAFMIGLGRAVGETIAVALVIGASPQVTANILGPGDTMASIIANQFGEASGTQRAALIGLGLLLLVLTMLIGILARSVLGRADRRLGQGA